MIIETIDSKNEFLSKKLNPYYIRTIHHFVDEINLTCSILNEVNDKDIISELISIRELIYLFLNLNEYGSKYEIELLRSETKFVVCLDREEVLKLKLLDIEYKKFIRSENSKCLG